MSGSNDHIFNEIVNNEIVDLGFKNPQYKKEYYDLFWKKYLSLFQYHFSSNFEFDISNLKLEKRDLYLEAKNKKDGSKILFILSLPEGQMPKAHNKILARLKFKNAVFKDYIKNFQEVLFITFYAPLKKIFVEGNDLEIIENTDFAKTVCLVSTLQEIWNSSKTYGVRYESVLLDTEYVKEEWISIQVDYLKVLSMIFENDSDLVSNFIVKLNSSVENSHPKFSSKQDNNSSFSIVLLKDIYNYVDFFIEKNKDFIQWAKKEYSNDVISTPEILEEQQVKDLIENKKIGKTEKIALIKSRVNQGVFREKIIKEYNHCIFTKIENKDLLVASHIKPWNCSSNEERLDKNNGFLFSPMFDKLFDKGYITFSDNQELIISNTLSGKVTELLNIKSGQIYDLKINNQKMKYLQYHRNNIFKC